MITIDAKKNVSRAFSRAAQSYDAHSALQKEAAVKTASLIKISAGSVLDIGCGTGAVTERLLDKAPRLKITCCDISQGMLTAARRKLGEKAAFIEADMESLPFAPESFDAVVSSLAYQWAIDTNAAFAEAFRVIKPGGEFVFSTLGAGTLAELRESVAEAAAKLCAEPLSFMEFKTADKIKESLRGAGFVEYELDVEKKVLSYDGLSGLLRTLKRIGALAPVRGKTGGGFFGKELLSLSSGIYAQRFSPDGSIVRCTYDVMHVSAKKP